MKTRLLRILIALDIFVFALLTLGGAKRNETISSAAWSLEMDRKWQGKLFRPTIDWAFSRLERDHCFQSWMAEQIQNSDEGVIGRPSPVSAVGGV
jgi:hypothetical protein